MAHETFLAAPGSPLLEDIAFACTILMQCPEAVWIEDLDVCALPERSPGLSLIVIAFCDR